MDLIYFLIIGGLAGWAAGTLVRGGGFGILGNVVVGILGAVGGGFLFDVLGISTEANSVGRFITALVGAVVLLVVLRVVKKA